MSDREENGRRSDDRDNREDRDRDRSRSRSPRRRSKSPRRRSKSRSRSAGGDRGVKRCEGEAVRWNDRGFGFIKPDDGGDDIFCHVSAITDGNMLQEGSKVTYEVRYDDRRRKERAENVKGGCEDRDFGGGGGGRDSRRGGGGRDRYDDRRGGGGRDRYDDRRGGGRDRYDDRRGGGGRDRRGGRY